MEKITDTVTITIDRYDAMLESCVDLENIRRVFSFNIPNDKKLSIISTFLSIDGDKNGMD